MDENVFETKIRSRWKAGPRGKSNIERTSSLILNIFFFFIRSFIINELQNLLLVLKVKQNKPFIIKVCVGRYKYTILEFDECTEP